MRNLFLHRLVPLVGLLLPAMSCALDFDSPFSQGASDAGLKDSSLESGKGGAAGKDSGPKDSSAGNGGIDGSAGIGATGGTPTGGAAGALGGQGGGTSAAGGSGGQGCSSPSEIDQDGDGWTVAQGDCDDCDPSKNPGAFDGAGGIGISGIDDDCNGVPDDALANCDTGLPLDSADPLHAAKALGLCSQTTEQATGAEKKWGVLSAKYVKADGTAGMAPLGHGLLSSFGAANVQHGAAMLALSTGTARAPNQPGYESPEGFSQGVSSAHPPGFPKGWPQCPGITPGDVLDPAALEVRLRVPTNAKSLRFRFNLYVFDFPEFVCNSYNDIFVVLLDPKPSALPDSNIAFDSLGGPLSVNSLLLQVCQAQSPKDAGVPYACSLGVSLLQNTGFSSHGATGWLQTQAPVTAGSIITLRFAVWDSGDGVLDSTVLIDQFEWSGQDAATSTAPAANPL